MKAMLGSLIIWEQGCVTKLQAERLTNCGFIAGMGKIFLPLLLSVQTNYGTHPTTYKAPGMSS